MLLNNFSKVSRGASTNAVALDGAAAANTTYTLSNYPTAYIQYSKGGRGWWLDVGFGTTDESRGDYKLDVSNAIDNPILEFVNGLISSDVPYIKGLTAVYRNESENDITVTEIGIVCNGATAANQIRYNVLIARKVLDTPVTLAPGETYAFTYSIEI